MQQIVEVGYETTSSESEGPPATVRFRFEGKNAMGEIVVWDYGATNLMLIDLQSDKYVVNQHDLVLVDDRYDQLTEFFEMALKLK